jgi:hypothetical protein
MITITTQAQPLRSPMAMIQNMAASQPECLCMYELQPMCNVATGHAYTYFVPIGTKWGPLFSENRNLIGTKLTGTSPKKSRDASILHQV